MVVLLLMAQDESLNSFSVFFFCFGRFLGYLGKGKLMGFSPAHCSENGGRSKGLVAWVPESSKVLDQV